ncbi:PilN domain-containing protein [Sulfoacidibacillus ferrooxidans]|uniref:Uncharacterized protein n=1 Tax=Sulfoacidibacillus ferrooxidans TaxID=2005001 RepID=A0A9X2AC51_9BACL|nr:hypothetical protein [Sulfoacidibacillus ferrooxidans]MCI0183788.1 hypothetical protein [Sulfoacidibacillus ferrooxidans]
MRINLLPPSPPAVRRRVFVFWGVLACLLLWALESGLSYDQTISTTAVTVKEYEATQSMIHPLEQHVATEQKKQSFDALIQLVTKLDDSLPIPEEAIEELQGKLPKSGILGAITYSNDTLSTTVYLNSYQQAATLLTALYDDPAFVQVQVSSVTDTISSQLTSHAQGHTINMGNLNSQSIQTAIQHALVAGTSGKNANISSPLSEYQSQNNETNFGAASNSVLNHPGQASLTISSMQNSQIGSDTQVTIRSNPIPPIQIALSMQVDEQQLKMMVAKG